MKSTLPDEKSSYKKKRISCPKCGSTNLALEEDETYCRECGLVIQGTPSIQKYPYGYIIGGKRQMYKIVKTKQKKQRIKNNCLGEKETMKKISQTLLFF